MALHLFVTVESGHNLVSRDTNGLSDPYCVMRLSTGDGTKKTRVVKKSLNPIWNQTFNTGPIKPESVLKLTCWDYDTFSSDDFMGQIVLDIGKMVGCDGTNSGSAWFPLEERNPKKPEGVLGGVKLTFYVLPAGQLPPCLQNEHVQTRDILDGVKGAVPSASFVNPVTKTFGEELTELMEKQKLRFPDLKIPVACHKMIEQILERGLKEEGLFRLAGGLSTINGLRARFDAGEDVDLSSVDLHDVACLFKLFLREMPTPLMPFSFYDENIKPFAPSIIGTDDWMESFKYALKSIPNVHFELLRQTSDMLCKIAANSEVNKMTVSNLVICLSPNIMWERDRSFNMNSSSKCGTVLSLMVEQYDYVFKFQPEIKASAPVRPKRSETEIISQEGKRVFHTYDFNGDGTMDRDEFSVFYRDTMALLGMGEVTEEDIDQAITLLDKDGNNEISFEEFAEWWSAINQDSAKMRTRPVPLGHSHSHEVARHEPAPQLKPSNSQAINRGLQQAARGFRGAAPRGGGAARGGAAGAPPRGGAGAAGGGGGGGGGGGAALSSSTSSSSSSSSAPPPALAVSSGSASSGAIQKGEGGRGGPAQIQGGGGGGGASCIVAPLSPSRSAPTPPAPSPAPVAPSASLSLSPSPPYLSRYEMTGPVPGRGRVVCNPIRGPGPGPARGPAGAGGGPGRGGPAGSSGGAGRGAGPAPGSASRGGAGAGAGGPPNQARGGAGAVRGRGAP